MSGPFSRHLVLLAGAWLVAAAATASAQGTAQGPEGAGRFLAVVGDVQVLGADGAQRPAERATGFREGETIVTRADGMAQLRMSDGSLISVRSDSEMKLERFAYKGEDDSKASFFLSVLKGGLRTVTGLIGKLNRPGYRITTPSATIGIRGTHFELVHVLPSAATPEAPAGTYNRVFDGVTTMQNKAGLELLVNRDQTAFVALQGLLPPVLVAPPAAIFGRPTAAPQTAPQSRRDSDKGQPAAPGTRDAGRPTPTDTRSPATLSPATATTTISPTTPIISPGTTTIRPPTTIQTTPLQTAPLQTSPIQTAPATTTIK
jgi:hypothetical protein